jgi:F0F1-type ATP synthase membrane subunit a
MTLQDPNVATTLALAVIYGMVVLGFSKRRLVWKSKCRVCGGPATRCHCRLPRF